jgi:hypothetical protein
LLHDLSNAGCTCGLFLVLYVLCGVLMFLRFRYYFFLLHAGTHWFCGHYHRNAGGVYRNNDITLECVTSGAVGTTLTTKEDENPLGLSGMGSVDLSEETSGFRIVNVTSTNVTHVWKSLSEF